MSRKAEIMGLALSSSLLALVLGILALDGKMSAGGMDAVSSILIAAGLACLFIGWVLSFYNDGNYLAASIAYLVFFVLYVAWILFSRWYGGLLACPALILGMHRAYRKWEDKIACMDSNKKNTPQ